MSISFEKVQAALADYCQRPPSEIERSTLLVDLDMDSLEKLEASFEIEDITGVAFTDNDLESFKSVGDIVDFCDTKREI